MCWQYSCPFVGSWYYGWRGCGTDVRRSREALEFGLRYGDHDGHVRSYHENDCKHGKSFSDTTSDEPRDWCSRRSSVFTQYYACRVECPSCDCSINGYAGIRWGYENYFWNAGSFWKSFGCPRYYVFSCCSYWRGSVFASGS